MKSFVNFCARTVFPVLALAIMAAVAAHADPIIQNGSFEAVTGLTGSSSEFGSHASGAAAGVEVTGWSTNGYNFVFIPGGSNPEAKSDFGANDVGLYGPPSVSPDGGNYLALDGAFEVGALTQTLHGLNPGESYYI